MDRLELQANLDYKMSLKNKKGASQCPAPSAQGGVTESRRVQRPDPGLQETSSPREVMQAKGGPARLGDNEAAVAAMPPAITAPLAGRSLCRGWRAGSWKPCNYVQAEEAP